MDIDAFEIKRELVYPQELVRAAKMQNTLI